VLPGVMPCMLPCGRTAEMALCSCAMWHRLGEVALPWAATWHCGGAHLSDDLCQSGTHMDDVVQ
jgi:hypothetical protein